MGAGVSLSFTADILFILDSNLSVDNEMKFYLKVVGQVYILYLFTYSKLFLILQVILSTLLFTLLKYLLPLRHTVPLVVTDIALINFVFIFYTFKVQEFSWTIVAAGYVLTIAVLVMRLIVTPKGVF